MDNLKQRLKEGEHILFTNEEHQVNAGKSDVREAYLMRRRAYSGQMEYFINFNGAFIHTCRSFESAERKIKSLIKKWNLKEVIK